jgi:hypothetical protein
MGRCTHKPEAASYKTDTTIDPAMPTPLEKNKNMRR